MRTNDDTREHDLVRAYHIDNEGRPEDLWLAWISAFGDLDVHDGILFQTLNHIAHRAVAGQPVELETAKKLAAIFQKYAPHFAEHGVAPVLAQYGDAPDLVAELHPVDLGAGLGDTIAVLVSYWRWLLVHGTGGAERIRQCRQCGRFFHDRSARANAEFCSGRCRVRAFRAP